jgi:hypothetical protein
MQSQLGIVQMAKKATTKPEPRDTPLSLRIKKSVREALAEAAATDQRPVSAMAEIILQSWLKENGFLK